MRASPGASTNPASGVLLGERQLLHQSSRTQRTAGRGGLGELWLVPAGVTPPDAQRLLGTAATSRKQLGNGGCQSFLRDHVWTLR